MPFPAGDNKSSGGRSKSNPFQQMLGGTKNAIQNMTSGPIAPPTPTFTPPPPVSSNSSGQYSGGGGGGAPRNVGPRTMGQVNGPGRSGGGGGGNRGGGGGGRNRPEPKVPGIKKFLAGDDVYQNQISALMKSLQDFQTSNVDQRGDVRSDFAKAMEKMNQERQRSIADMEADFASRGLLNSGLFTDAVGDFETDFQSRTGDLTTDRSRVLEDLLESMGMFRDENRTQRQNARQEAVRRRAEQFGLKL